MDGALARRLESLFPLAASDVAAIRELEHGRRFRVAQRQDIAKEGQSARSVHLLLSGWACLYSVLSNGRRQILSICLPGDFCDPYAFLLPRRQHSIGALTAASVAIITPESIDRICSVHPQLGRAVRLSHAMTFALQCELAISLGQRTAFEKLACLLYEIFVRAAAAGLTVGNSCDLPLTQSDLADVCGLTPVHVNRMLQELRRASLLTLCRRQLTNPDPAALAAAALLDPARLLIAHMGERSALYEFAGSRAAEAQLAVA